MVFIISVQGVKATPEKVESIRKFPEPKSIKRLQNFLGLCNFYRKFYQDYAQLTTKLTAILQKNNLWRWDYEEWMVFQEIKDRSANIT